jgi:HEAT repeat protein
MNTKYWIVIVIIIIQFTLITLMIIASLTSKAILTLRNSAKAKAKLKIEKYLLELIDQNKHFSNETFPHKWQRLSILLHVIKKLDAQVVDPAWQSIRANLLSTIILPLARQKTEVNSWTNQFYAAQAFELYAEESDQEMITTLINSQVPVVRLAALRAAILYGSEQAFSDLIHEMQDQSPLNQSIYIQAFANAPHNTRVYIENILNASSDIKTRLTCYRILLSYPPQQMNWLGNADIHSDIFTIKLAALRLLAYTQKEEAIPVLLEELNDKNWEVKVVVLNALSNLNVTENIPEIAKCLHDQNWWVSLTAATALKNMGEEGEQALGNISETTIDPKAFAVVRHVLHLL